MDIVKLLHWEVQKVFLPVFYYMLNGYPIMDFEKQMEDDGAPLHHHLRNHHSATPPWLAPIPPQLSPFLQLETLKRNHQSKSPHWIWKIPGCKWICLYIYISWTPHFQRIWSGGWINHCKLQPLNFEWTVSIPCGTGLIQWRVSGTINQFIGLKTYAHLPFGSLGKQPAKQLLPLQNQNAAHF